MIATAPTTLDLSTLPERRRRRVLSVYAREAAAERIREVCPVKMARWKRPEAYRRTAEQVAAERPEWGGIVTHRFVQAVMREGR